jgi:hypothetical protein
MGYALGWKISSYRTFKLFNLIILSEGFVTNVGNGGVHTTSLQFTVKFVIKFPILDLKIMDAVTSAIDMLADEYGLAVSRYFSPAVYMVNGKELKDPNKGALVSPE